MFGLENHIFGLSVWPLMTGFTVYMLFTDSSGMVCQCDPMKVLATFTLELDTNSAPF